MATSRGPVTDQWEAWLQTAVVQHPEQTVSRHRRIWPFFSARSVHGSLLDLICQKQWIFPKEMAFFKNMGGAGWGLLALTQVCLHKSGCLQRRSSERQHRSCDRGCTTITISRNIARYKTGGREREVCSQGRGPSSVYLASALLLQHGWGTGTGAVKNQTVIDILRRKSIILNQCLVVEANDKRWNCMIVGEFLCMGPYFLFPCVCKFQPTFYATII